MLSKGLTCSEIKTIRQTQRLNQAEFWDAVGVTLNRPEYFGDSLS